MKDGVIVSVLSAALALFSAQATELLNENTQNDPLIWIEAEDAIQKNIYRNETKATLLDLNGMAEDTPVKVERGDGKISVEFPPNTMYLILSEG